MTSGGVRDVWSGIRSIIVSVFVSDALQPAAWKTVTKTVVISANPCADIETMRASSAEVDTMVEGHCVRYEYI